MRVLKDDKFWIFINEKGESLKIEADSFYDRDRLQRENEEGKKRAMIQFLVDNFALLSVALTALTCFSLVYLIYLIKKLIDWNIRVF